MNKTINKISRYLLILFPAVILGIFVFGVYFWETGVNGTKFLGLAGIVVSVTMLLGLIMVLINHQLKEVAHHNTEGEKDE